MYTINIGLQTSANTIPGAEPIPASIAYSVAVDLLGSALAHRIVDDPQAGERTLALAFPAKADHSIIAKVADVLDQDCIAVLDHDGRGSLVGQRAHAWGEFNPAYFHVVALGGRMPDEY